MLVYSFRMTGDSGIEEHVFYRSGCYYERPGNCCLVCFFHLLLAVLLR